MREVFERNLMLLPRTGYDGIGMSILNKLFKMNAGDAITFTPDIVECIGNQMAFSTYGKRALIGDVLGAVFFCDVQILPSGNYVFTKTQKTYSTSWKTVEEDFSHRAFSRHPPSDPRLDMKMTVHQANFITTKHEAYDSIDPLPDWLSDRSKLHRAFSKYAEGMDLRKFFDYHSEPYRYERAFKMPESSFRSIKDREAFEREYMADFELSGSSILKPTATSGVRSFKFRSPAPSLGDLSSLADTFLAVKKNTARDLNNLIRPITRTSEICKEVYSALHFASPGSEVSIHKDKISKAFHDSQSRYGDLTKYIDAVCNVFRLKPSFEGEYMRATKSEETVAISDDGVTFFDARSGAVGEVVEFVDWFSGLTGASEDTPDVISENDEAELSELLKFITFDGYGDFA